MLNSIKMTCTQKKRVESKRQLIQFLWNTNQVSEEIHDEMPVESPEDGGQTDELSPRDVQLLYIRWTSVKLSRPKSSQVYGAQITFNIGIFTR